MFKKIALSAAGIIILVGVLLAVNFNQKLNRMEINMDNVIVKNEPARDRDKPISSLTNHTEEEPEPEDFYVLLIGLDQRGHDLMLNTDSLIVAHIVPQQHIVKLLSIPRDQKIADPHHPLQYVKINSIFADGYNHALHEARKDPSLLSGKKVTIGNKKIAEEYISSGMVSLRETIESFLSIPIKNTFLVNFDTVIGLVDKVGGIEIDVDRSMQYDAEFDGTHIHLEKGMQILYGQDALNYARFREDNRGPDYFSSDFDRGRRQQEVISALVKKMSSWGNITKALDLLDIVTSNVKTDMKRGEMVALIRDFYGNLDGSTIVPIPYKAYWKSPYVHIDEKDLKEMLELFTSIDRPTELTNESSGNPL